MTEPDPVPIACSLSAEDLPGREAEWRSLAAASSTRERIDGGVRLTIPASARSLADVVDITRREKECCPFFTFTLIEQQPGMILEIRAPADAEAMLEGLLD
ncbi:MAG: hypothetical protein ABR564_09725 [Candidatus Dormibacteria bacterium]